MDQGSGTTVLGLPGFVLLAASEEDGELHLLVETTATQTGCAECGTRARSKGRTVVQVRDMAAGGRPVRLWWRKRRWSCPDADCGAKTWTEQSEAVAPRAVLSERAAADVCWRVGRDAASVAALAREYRISWSTAMAAVARHGVPVTEDPDRIGAVAELGVDETAFARSGPGRRPSFVTGMVDLEAVRLLDVVRGRSGKDLAAWLATRPPEWCQQVATVAIDPHEGYRQGLKPALAHARLVVDPFHVTALANRAIDDVRRRVNQELLGHRGRKDDPLYRIRRVLLTGAERLSARAWQRMAEGLRLGDPADEVLDAWLAKEHVRDVYLTDDAAEAAELLAKALRFCAASHVAEVRRLGRTLAAWSAEILAHHDTGASAGPTEAMNLLIEKVRRVGHGFRRFDNYRLRLLLHCGVEWPERPGVVLRPKRHHHRFTTAA
jgi:transposase